MRDGDFRVRSNEISRIEGLSDAVFGFAITLLVVSLEVPKTSAEVLRAMRGFVPFALTFTILILIWRNQFRFFRRYGLEDNRTLALNAVLLFVVLFFVYPLKYIFGAISERIFYHLGYGDPATVNFIADENTRLLMVAYGLGWATVNGVFALLYKHAYQQRHRLRLSELELFDTEQTIRLCSIVAVFGVLIAATNGLAHFFDVRGAVNTAGIIDAVGNLAALAAVGRLAMTARKRRRRRAELVAAEDAEVLAHHGTHAEAREPASVHG